MTHPANEDGTNLSQRSNVPRNLVRSLDSGWRLALHALQAPTLKLDQVTARRQSPFHFDVLYEPHIVLVLVMRAGERGSTQQLLDHYAQRSSQVGDRSPEWDLSLP